MKQKKGKALPRKDKVDYLLDVATDMFNRSGYHASGIDQLIAETGIAKTTLYRHFESKDALIIAVLKRIDNRYRTEMRRYVDQAATEPGARILATFDYLLSWFESDDFFGCPFMSAGSEYNNRSDPIFQEARLHKRLVIAYFEELAHAAGFKDARKVANEIHLLHEGATAIAHISGETAIAGDAKQLAARLLQNPDT